MAFEAASTLGPILVEIHFISRALISMAYSRIVLGMWKTMGEKFL